MAKIQYAQKDRIAVITLDDGKVNAMNYEFFNELNDALDRAQADAAGAVIFTCRTAIFSAGLDLKLIASQSLMEQMKFLKVFAETMLRIYQFPIPTIAAYRGHSVAGGLILSCACDRIMVSDGPYKMQLNEVITGMLLPSWILLICRSAIPPHAWTEALLHARAYTPREAFERGIVDELIAEDADVGQAAEGYACGLLNLKLHAYDAAKKLLRERDAANVLDVFEKELMTWYMRYGAPGQS